MSENNFATIGNIDDAEFRNVGKVLLYTVLVGNHLDAEDQSEEDCNEESAKSMDKAESLATKLVSKCDFDENTFALSDAALCHKGSEAEELWKIGVLFSGCIAADLLRDWAEDCKEWDMAGRLYAEWLERMDKWVRLAERLIEGKAEKLGEKAFKRWFLSLAKTMEEIEND